MSFYNLDLIQNICSMNGWKTGSDKHTFVQKLFAMLWRKLQDDADRDFDGVVTDQEWVKNKLVVFVTLPYTRFLVKKHPSRYRGTSLLCTDEGSLYHGVMICRSRYSLF